METAIRNYEDVDSWKTVMFLYTSALKEVGTKQMCIRDSRLTFAVTAENESGEKVYDDKVTYSVNTSAKPESQKEDSKSDNSGQSAGGSNDGGNIDAYAGGVDNGDRCTVAAEAVKLLAMVLFRELS